MRVLFHLLDAGLAGGQIVAHHVAREAAARDWRIGLLVPAPGPMVDRFRTLGARVHVVSLRSLRRPWGVVAARDALRGYDVLYSHTTVPGEILGDLAARMAGRPHVMHEHAPLGPTFASQRAVAAVQRVLFRGIDADRVIAVADHVAAALVRAGIFRNRIVVIPNGAPDLPRPQVRTSPPVRVGMLGRLDDAQKGVADFVAAVEPLLAEGIEAVVGARRPSGAERDIARRLAGGRVRLVEPAGGVEFLEALDVVAIPSRYEGSPLVLFEAMALARSIVASDVPGIREVVEDGRNGLLVAPGDVQGLRDAIRRLTSDENLRRTLGEAARLDAETRFRMSDTVARCLEVLETVARPTRPR